jgi:RNA polymerase sigma-70 factor (ECF subfamily)
VSADDVDRLARVFAEDVVLWADGGGKVRAARHPLHGATRVARHLVGVRPQTPPHTEVRLVRVNGDPGIMGVVDGSSIGLLVFEIAEGLVTAVRAILNPEKLAMVRVN